MKVSSTDVGEAPPRYDPMRCTIKIDGLELAEEAIRRMGLTMNEVGASMGAFREAVARAELAQMRAFFSPGEPRVVVRPEADPFMAERGGTRLIDLGED